MSWLGLDNPFSSSSLPACVPRRHWCFSESFFPLPFHWCMLLFLLQFIIPKHETYRNHPKISNDRKSIPVDGEERPVIRTFWGLWLRLRRWRFDGFPLLGSDRYSQGLLLFLSPFVIRGDDEGAEAPLNLCCCWAAAASSSLRSSFLKNHMKLLYFRLMGLDDFCDAAANLTPLFQEILVLSLTGSCVVF